MIITSVTNEYSYKTTRQNIIDGWSRLQFIQVKIALVVILALVSTIFVFLTALLFGIISGSSFSFLKIEHISYYFIQAVSYSMVALLFSLLIKRSGLAIGAFFLYSLIIENAIGALINYYSRSGRSGIKMNGLGDYLPLNTVDYLIPFPFFRNVVQFSTQPSIYLLLGFSAAYLALYYYISVRKFQKDDL
jgi:ABC-2 type transport system permease protein